jgi:hypothetical protein
MKENIDRLEENLNGQIGLKKNSFSVPEGYFDNLHQSIMDKIETLPDFEKSAVKNPFNVPENYFERLPIDISQIISEKNSLSESRIFFNRPRFIIPVAFATIIILAGIFFTKQNKTADYQSQEISLDELKNSTYIECIDEDLFVDAIAQQTSVTEDENIKQYLIDNNIDLSQIEYNL